MVWKLSCALDLRAGRGSAGGIRDAYAHEVGHQHVFGKVTNMMATNRARGNARKAPGPPSSQAQNTNDIKTTVGEMQRPRLIIIGERTFSARMLTIVTPAITSNVRPTPNLASARRTAGATSSTSPM